MPYDHLNTGGTTLTQDSSSANVDGPCPAAQGATQPMARDLKDIAHTTVAPKTATKRAGISDGSELDRSPVHPAVIRMLARQAVAEDIAAQRSIAAQGD